MNILQQIAALLGVKLTKVHEKTVANKEAIEAEADRAKGAEETIINNLNSEISRAKAAEKANTDAITAIDEAYQEADTALQTAINNEAAARTAADNSLSARITTEVGERKEADTALDEKKVDKVEGKQLSTEDYTTAEKTKVGNLSSYVVDNIFAKDTGSANLTLNYNTKDPVTGTITKHITLVPTVSSTICGVVSPSQKLVLDNLISGDSALSTLGTPSSTWQLNLGSGPKIKNSGGIFELRNAADNAYADLTVNALTIKGNVTQEGGSFITQAETVSAKDNTILLNSGETGAGVTKGTAGVEIDRGTLPKYKFIFDESDDRFKVGSEGDLWSVMLRDNETDLTDKGILTWDATTKRAKTAFNIDDLADTYLPLAGGTMTGLLTIGKTSGIYFNDDKDIIAAALGYTAGSTTLYLGTPSVGGRVLITGELYRSVNGIASKVWDESNDGADSGLDADLLDGQHGSYYAKATDLGRYIPLAGNSKETPITGHLYTEDVFSWGLYGMKIEGADGLPRTTHIQFNANQTGAMGSEPAKSNAYTEMGSIGEVWGPNTVSQLRVGYEDNLPVLKYRNNPEGPEIKEYNIYHEGNLDVNSMVSGFLPLSAGASKLMTDAIWFKNSYNTGNPSIGNYGRAIQFIAGGTTEPCLTSSESETEISGELICKGIQIEDKNVYINQITTNNGGREIMPDIVFRQVNPGQEYAKISSTYRELTIDTWLDATSNFSGIINLMAGQLYRRDKHTNERYTIFDEGNLHLSNYVLGTELDSKLSGYLPLRGGTMTGNIILPKNVSNNPSLKGLIGEPGWLTQPAGIRGNSILTYHEDNIMLGNDKAILQSIAHTSVIVAENELILSAPMIAINTASISCGGEAEIWTSGNDGAGSGLDADLLDGKQGSEYALVSNLNSYLPLSAGASHKLTGALWAPIGTPGGASHFNVNVIAGSSTVAHAGIEANANGMAVGFGAHEVGDAYFWIGGNGTQDKDYFAKVNKTSKGMNFLYRPMYNGTNLATISEIPTIPSSLPNPQSITFTGAATGTYNGSSTLTINIPSVPSLSGGAGATSGQYVSGVTVSGHTVTVSKASLPTSLPANGGNATTATSSTALSVRDLRVSAIAPTYGEKALVAWFNNLGTPNGEWWSGIHVKGWEAGYQAWQLAGPSDSKNPATDALWYKSGRSSAWNTWRRLAFANEIPTTLPASDVYAWAKASTKPSYAWSEITGKPTIPSLSGYATQSWVQSQGYLTSHQSLANYVTLNTTQTISGAKTFTAFVVCSAGSGTSSDIRLKKYINRMFDAEEVLSNLSGYRYVMKETDMHYAGLIAQEVQEVLPEAVREDENGFLTVDTYPIVAALVEANKAKDNRIKALEDRLSTLEKKMSLILNRIGG